MRIEILVDSEEPQIYPINKSKLLIGTHESCDIVLNNDGVSRKHLAILAEDDNYFAIDQGSTNGSYINEERLVPGRRVEFTSFFPIRLGDNVLVVLVSDDNVSDLDASGPITIPIPGKKEVSEIPRAKTPETTRMISLKDLQNAKTETLVKRRQEIVSSKKKAPKKKINADQKRMGLVKLAAVMMVGLAIYYNFFMKKPVEVTELPASEVGKVVKGPPAPETVTPSIPEEKGLLLTDSDLTSLEKFGVLLNDIKCSSDVEKYFCAQIPGASGGQWGATQTGTMVNVMLDGSPYFVEAKTILPAPQPLPNEATLSLEAIAVYEKNVKFLAVLLFIHRGIPRNLDWAIIGESNMSFALFTQEDSVQKVQNIAAFTPEGLKKIQETLTDQHLNSAKKYGMDILAFTQQYFRLY